jgi:multidrug resistance efflux pump
MSRKAFFIILALTAVVSVIVFFATRARTRGMVLTGIVTTDQVIVSSQISGRLARVEVKEGDAVSAGRLLAVIAPEELKADQAFYAHSEEKDAAAVWEAEAALNYQSLQTRDQIRQAEATLAGLEASVAQAKAELERARLDFERAEALFAQVIIAAQAHDLARTAYQAQVAAVDSLEKQTQAQRAAVALARSTAEQISVRQSQLLQGRHQLAAAEAQKLGAQVRLGYTEIRSPLNGLVAVRAALQGEVVSPGQAIVVLYDPDNLWVRADVEETYIDRIRLGDRLLVRFPSSLERLGTVFFRGVDADYATQRDVSRTKRDIKTFEIRLRVDNHDRRLSPGLTAFVTVPLGQGS